MSSNDTNNRGGAFPVTEDTEDATGPGITSGRLVEDDGPGFGIDDERGERGNRLPVTDSDAAGHAFKLHLMDEPEADSQPQVTSGHKF